MTFSFFFTALCGPTERHFTEKVDFITSPSYPHPYPLDVTCRWRISGTEYYNVYYIHFIDFQLKDTPECDEDYLEITDLNVSCN